MLLILGKKLNHKKNLLQNFLMLYGINHPKIKKILRLLGVSFKNLKIETDLKIILLKLLRQNLIYSKDKIVDKFKLRINFLKKIKCFRSFNFK